MFTRFLVPFALACAAFAQTPAFEVASVKVSEPITPALVQSGRLHMGVTIDSINVRISKLSMLELVALAYQIKGDQISGPDWISTQRYDIQAKLPEGGSRGQVPAMLQTLIAERFGMRFHREARDFNVFALVVAKRRLASESVGRRGRACRSATWRPNPRRSVRRTRRDDGVYGARR
jgi:uncharacterized protein (TIGR03435 family)